MTKLHVISGIAIVVATSASAAGYSPLSVTPNSYNADVVVERTVPRLEQAIRSHPSVAFKEKNSKVLKCKNPAAEIETKAGLLNEHLDSPGRAVEVLKAENSNSLSGNGGMREPVPWLAGSRVD